MLGLRKPRACGKWVGRGRAPPYLSTWSHHGGRCAENAVAASGARCSSTTRPVEGEIHQQESTTTCGARCALESKSASCGRERDRERDRDRDRETAQVTIVPVPFPLFCFLHSRAPVPLCLARTATANIVSPCFACLANVRATCARTTPRCTPFDCNVVTRGWSLRVRVEARA